MSLVSRLRDAAAGGATAVDLNDESMAGKSHDEKILRQLRHEERELSEQVAQMRAELKRRREDAPTRNAAKRALADASLAVASDATVAVSATRDSGDKFDPTSRQEVEAIATMAGIRVTEASSRISSAAASGARVVRTRHYVLCGRVEDAIEVRLAFDVDEGALMDKMSDRDIAITGAVVRLEPLFAMVELDDLVAAAESKGAVGRLLTVLPRYARATQVRKTAFSAARELMRNKCDIVQHDSDDDFELVLRCRPTAAHLFAFDVLWDLDFDAASNRVRSTLAFACYPSPLFSSTNSKLVSGMEHRFLQLVQQCGLLRAVEIMVEMAICFLTTFHDATVSQENTPQNVWGGDDYALGCMGEAAYALIPKSSALTTGMLVSGFGFKNETALQANSRILKVDVRLWAFAGADRRTSTTKFHIGLESVVVRSGGLDIYSQLFGGEPRLLSATPIQLDVSLEKIQSIGSMLFRGDQALSEQFGIVTYWRNHDSTSNWHVNLDCVQARLMFENDAPPTPQPPPRPTTNGPILTTPSPTTTTTPLTTTTHAATGGDDTNATSVASLFTFQDHASDTALALSTETVIAIVVPVAAACVLCITVGVICILRRRANDRKPSASTPAAKDKVERRKETLRVQNNAFEGTPLASPPDTAAAPEPAAPPAESPRPVQPQPVTTTVVAKSVALPTQPEKPSHIVIASYPALRAQPAATALAAPANTAGAPAGVIFVERGYEVPYSFDSDSQQVYMGQHGVAANFTPAVGHEAHANMLLDRHVRDQYASPAKQNQVLDDIF